MKTMCDTCLNLSQRHDCCSQGLPLLSSQSDICGEYNPNPGRCIEKEPIRKFRTGATRDTTEGKLSYVKALSPIALRRYVQYLDQHRKQPDGSVRDFDNWKQGIPQDVYLESLDRHKRAVWLICHGYKAYDNHGEVTLEDSLCGVLFNAMGMLHELLKDKVEKIEVDRTMSIEGEY